LTLNVRKDYFTPLPVIRCQYYYALCISLIEALDGIKSVKN